MHHILIALLRVCLILIGGVALYIGFFLYEDEEGAFHSRIMKFSVSLKARLNAKDLPLARDAASLVTVALNRIFGRGPFSWRLIFSSMALSFAALSGFLLLLNILYPLYPRNAGTMVFMVYSTIALSLTGMVILCSIYDHRWLLAFGSIPVVLIMIFIFVKTPDVGYSVIPYSIVSDVACLIAIRRSLRRICTKPTKSVLMGSILIQMGVGVFCFYAPLIGMENLWRAGIVRPAGEHGLSLSSFGATVFIFNLPTLLVASAFVIVLVFLLTDKLFWPVTARIVYPIARFKLMQNRKFLFSFAIACFGCASPWFGTSLEKVSGWLK